MSLIEQSICEDQLIEIGEIKSAYGIKGWVKVFSFTRPVKQIFSYPAWLIGRAGYWRRIEIEDKHQRPNGGLIAKLTGIDERTCALGLSGKMIAIEKSELKELADDEYYWSQLIGLNVINTRSKSLGTVTELLETGANDVLVVKNGTSEQLIPYGDCIIKRVDIEMNQLIVDWEISD